MEIVTHALLGALGAAAINRQTPNRRASAASGAIAALVPDLDILIRSAEDPLLVLEYHRHFSHSLLVAPVAAALVALLLWPLLRRWLQPRHLYIAALTGYISACLLDACTSYGTYLFWPLVEQPLSLGIIAVLDPLFTLLVLLGLIAVFKLPDSPWRWIGPAAAALYLMLGYIQLQRALDHGTQWAMENDMAPDHIVAKPAMANILLWRVLVVEESFIHARAVHLAPFASVGYAGESAQQVNPHTWGSLPEQSRAYRDLQRFHSFAEGLLVADPRNPSRIGDARYAMLPNSVVPLWGIEIDVHNPDRIPEFFTQRDAGPDMRKTFIAMLRGQTLH